VLDVEYEVPDRVLSDASVWTGSLRLEITGPVTLVDLAATECLQWEETFRVRRSAGGPESVALEVWLRDASGLPRVHGVSTVLIDHRTYGIRWVTAPWFLALQAAGIIGKDLHFTENYYLLVTDESDGCPVLDAETLKTVILTYEKGSLLVSEDPVKLRETLDRINSIKGRHYLSGALALNAKVFASIAGGLATSGTTTLGTLLKEAGKAAVSEIVAEVLGGSFTSPTELLRGITAEFLEKTQKTLNTVIDWKNHFRGSAVGMDVHPIAYSLDAYSHSFASLCELDYEAWRLFPIETALDCLNSAAGGLVEKELGAQGLPDAVAWSASTTEQVIYEVGMKWLQSTLCKQLADAVSDSEEAFRGMGLDYPSELREFVTLGTEIAVAITTFPPLRAACPNSLHLLEDMCVTLKRIAQSEKKLFELRRNEIAFAIQETLSQ